jgi:hypothetical protein
MLDKEIELDKDFITIDKNASLLCYFHDKRKKEKNLKSIIPDNLNDKTKLIKVDSI